MQSVDLQVLSQVAKWLSSHSDCWLATVVQTYGSSPRPEGSVFACDRQGNVVGSLSGGCIEEDLIEKLMQNQIASDKPEFLRYGENPSELEKFELPCGGYLDIVVEPLQATATLVRRFDKIRQRIEHQQHIRRQVDLATGETKLIEETKFSPFYYDHDQFKLDQCFGPRWQLFVIGTNMVAYYVCELALMLDYQVTLIDTNRNNFKSFEDSKVTCICDTPDDVINERVNDGTSAVVALSHDPRLDDLALMSALETPAFYIGAMGSERTTTRRRARLLALGVTENLLNRLHAPIGIPIGSKTPPEIALSVMADVTRVRNFIVSGNRITIPLIVD
ncbi:MAG: XdhC family protein [Gammaproteobacteria bacterium]|nr:XdhC family protein [Gammaproteobacteria bacterium]